MATPTSLNLPIGVSDFQKLIQYRNPTGQGYLFVDKSLFIKEILMDPAQVIVLTRPRRFGKTLNLSMLHNFLADQVHGKYTKDLFNNLKIQQDQPCMQQQGQNPVIFITFKGIKELNFDSTINGFLDLVKDLYSQWSELLLQSSKTSDIDRALISDAIYQRLSLDQLKRSIKNLVAIIAKVTNKSVYILIDEYDSPIQEAYVHGYYEQLIAFFRGFLGDVLKDNSFVEKSILTGILRISKESLFSGLNNITIYSVLNKKYAQYFGFTEEEANELIAKTGLALDLQQTKNWYNGYNFGGVTVYNPWSMIEFLRNEGNLTAYWINTSSNDIIKKLIINYNYNIQADLQKLLAGQTIKKYINEHIVFNNLTTDPEAIWGLLLMSGYLKYIWAEYDEFGNNEFELQLPNREVENFYVTTVGQWLAANQDLGWYKEFLVDLTTGRVEAFEEKLQKLIEESLSIHDVTKKSQEAFYHGLMLGLVAGLRRTHIINSNKESGQGRYDVAIIPKDNSQLGIIMEFKAVQLNSRAKSKETQLATAAQQALQQINQSKYVAELHNHGVENICAMGVAFSSKIVKVVT